MERSPLVMQVFLLLLCVLARYIWDLSRTVATAAAAFTILGFACLRFYRLRCGHLEGTPVPPPHHLCFQLDKRPGFRLLRGISRSLPWLSRPRESNESFTATRAAVDSYGLGVDED